MERKQRQRCACGCGMLTTRVVKRLREQDRGTAEALNWAWASVEPMKESLALRRGHESPYHLEPSEESGK